MSSSFTCPNGHPVEAADTVCPHCGTLTQTEPLPAPAGPALPSVPGYEVLGVLGRGGMGVVYKARQVSLHRLVALKMIRDGALAGPEERARLRAEAEAVARLQHPNVVQVYEVGEHEGHPYFSLEFVPGGSLAEQLHGAPQPPRPAAQTVALLARAAHAAHQQGIVHRDLKPANILLSPLPDGGEGSGVRGIGTPKITDFGLAKRLEGVTAHTQSGAIVGTPSYMAPEQAQGRSGGIGPATEVHALGAILYEMLTGRPPFLGETTLDTLQQVLIQEPVPPSRLRPGLPRDLETICLHCLRKEPGRRYPSAEALADDLERFLRGEPIQARPAGRGERLWKWARRRPAAAALVLVSSLSVLALAAGAVVHDAQLRKALQQAEANEAATRREHALVMSQFRDAGDTLEHMLGRLDSKHRADAPTLKELRRALLKDSLAFYQKSLDRDNDPDPAIRLDAAHAYRKVGAIQHELGEPEAAADNFRRAIALFEELPDDFRQQTDTQIWLSECHLGLASLAMNPDHMDDAERHCLDSLNISTAIFDQHADSPELRYNMAEAEHMLGSIQMSRKHPAQAETRFRRVIELLGPLVKPPSEAPLYQQGLAETYQNLGVLYMTTRRGGEADNAYRKAHELLGALVGKYPEAWEYRLSLSSVYNNWSSLFEHSSRPRKALWLLDQAVQFADEALRLEPRSTKVRVGAHTAHHHRAVLYDYLSRSAEIFQGWNTAAELSGKAAWDWDRVVELSSGEDRLGARLNLTAALALSGQHDRAAAEAGDLAANLRDSDGILYQLAGVYAAAILAARRDGQLTPAEQAEAAKQYGDAAIALLKRLQKAGYFQAAERLDLLKSDANLQPLRDRPDFRKLLEKK